MTKRDLLFYKRLLPKLLIGCCLLLSCRRDKHAEALLNYEEGARWEELNFPDSAVNAYRKAIDLLDGSGKYDLLGDIYSRLGDLLLTNEVYDRAFEAYEKGLQYGMKLEDKTFASQAYRGMGKSFLLRKKPEEALGYFLKAKQLKNEIGDKEERSSVYNNLSNIYRVLGQYEKALKCSEEAIRLTVDSLKIYRNYAVKGKLLTLLHHYDSAYYYLMLGSRSPSIRTQVSCWYKLAEMPAEAGLSDSAKYVWLNKAQLLNDSIEEMNKTVQIAEAEHLHSLKRFKDKEKSKFLYVISSCVIAALGIILFLYERYRRRLKLHQEKIDRLYATYQGKEEQRNSDNDSREKQIITIVSRTGIACAAHFVSLPYYTELKNKLNVENYSLTYTESDELQRIVFKEFDNYIQQISSIINLSANDILLCCLSLLKFTTKECAACRGVGSEAIRSQRTRIKKKIPKSFLDNRLFDVLFGEE